MIHVASCLLINDEGKLLILKRSDKVRTYKCMWGVITGYVEEDEEPIDTAYKELKEEIGVKGEEVSLIKEIDPVEFTDIYDGKSYDWIVHPFLFKIEKKSKLEIDWEHTEYSWIQPPELGKYDTVPKLREIVLKILC